MKRKTNIALVHLRPRTPPGVNFPIAIMLIRAYAYKSPAIKKHVNIIPKEFYTSQDGRKLANEILQLKPKAVAFSCYIWNIRLTLLVAKILKEKNPNLTIILGGPEVSPLAKDVLKNNAFIDIVIRDEGEITFREYAKAVIKDEADLKNILGITYRSKKGIIENKTRPQLKNLGSIPFPYEPKLIPIKEREVHLEIQRGCTYKCHFCGYNKNYKGIRYLSIDKTKEYISYLLKQKPRVIYLLAPVFNSDLKRAKSICRHIIKHNKQGICFHVELKAELIDEELASLLSKCNITEIEIGLQSTNGSTLKRINRINNPEKIERGLKLLSKYGSTYDLQVIYGLPGEGIESFIKTLRKLYNLVLDNNSVAASIFKLHVLPGTEFWINAHRYGIDFNRNPPHTVKKTDVLSVKDIAYLDRLVNVIRVFFKMRFFRFLSKDLGISIVDLAIKWLETMGPFDNFFIDPDPKSVHGQISEFLRILSLKSDKIKYDFYKSILDKEVLIPKLKRVS